MRTTRSSDTAVTRHLPDMVRMAWLATGDRARAEDCVSEAMARVLVKHRKGKVDDVGPYLRRAVLNEVASAGRSRGVHARGIAKIAGDSRGERHADDDVTDRSALLTALAALPQRQRLCVVLRFYEQLSVAETAAAMSVSEGTVKSTTARGLAAMRDILGEESR